MLTKGEIIDYINERLTNLGLFEYRKEDSEYKLIGLFSDKYTISVREINYNSIRCELNKREIIGGTIFAGKVYTSCVVYDGRKNNYKSLDEWIKNMLLIPDVKLRIRNNKIKKLQKNIS